MRRSPTRPRGRAPPDPVAMRTPLVGAFLLVLPAPLQAQERTQEVDFETLRVDASAMTPGIKLISERLPDDGTLCQELGKQDLFYLEARYHAVTQGRPVGDLPTFKLGPATIPNVPLDLRACIYNSTSGFWSPYALEARVGLTGTWWLTDKERSYCRCVEGTSTGTPGLNPLEFGARGSCELTDICSELRSFAYASQPTRSPYAHLVPYDKKLWKIDKAWRRVPGDPPFCPAELVERHFWANRDCEDLSGYERRTCFQEHDVREQLRCRSPLPQAAALMDSPSVMLIKTRGSSYLLSPDDPHFYAVVWSPDPAPESP